MQGSGAVTQRRRTKHRHQKPETDQSLLNRGLTSGQERREEGKERQKRRKRERRKGGGAGRTLGESGMC